MNISMQYFLIVTEERSISRAAERLFVSQQCVSSHIKKLEQTYQAKLFTRKPSFRLTPEGEALRRNLLRQSVLEEALNQELSELKEERSHKIRVGIHNTRATLLLPDIIQEFQKDFEDVSIEIYQGETKLFETMLLEGKLDLFLATDTGERPEFRCTFLQQEPIFLIVTESLLKRHGLEQVLETHSITATHLADIPLICSSKNSYLQSKIDAWLAEQNVTIVPKIIVDTFQIKLMLAAQDSGACFCPQMFFRTVNDINGNSSPHQNLISVSIGGFNLSTEISIITHRDAYQSQCLRRFSALLQRSIIDALNTPLK